MTAPEDRITMWVEGHEFVALGRTDRFGQRGRCRHCYAPRYAHPVPMWDHSRVYGDRWGHRIPWRWARS